MQNNVATEADLLRIGYDVGYFDKADIVSWADRQIEACDEPPTELLDLSMIRQTHPIDVMNLLRTFGAPDPFTTIETQIGFLGLLYARGDITTGRAIRALFALVLEQGVTQEQQGTIYYLDDGYDLAIAGYYGAIGVIERELNEFVTPYVNQLVNNQPSLISSNQSD